MVSRCGTCLALKPPEGFYASNQTKCKACVRDAVKSHRRANLDAIRAYDRQRSKLPHRIAGSVRVTREWRRKHRDRLRAHNMSARAHLEAPTACEGCGQEARLEKHHPDYSQPLLVIWFCKPCHAVADKIRRRLEAS